MFLLDTTVFATCGDLGVSMDTMIPGLTNTAVTIIKIVIPIILIFFGMLDLGKAVMAQKEDEIKKGQQTFVKRLVAAVIVFLVVFVVQIVVGLVAGNDKQNISDCINCFMNNDCTLVDSEGYKVDENGNRVKSDDGSSIKVID